MKKILMATLAAFALAPVAGHANPINVIGFGLPIGEIAAIHYNDGVVSLDEAVDAGQIVLALPAGHSELVWSDDIFHGLHTGEFSIAPQPHFDSSLFNTIGALVLHGNMAHQASGACFAELAAAEQNAIATGFPLSQEEIDNVTFGCNHLDGPSITEVSAATQLAIWQVEYGDAFSFTANDPDLNGLVSTYIGNAQDGTFKPTNHLLEWVSDGNQSQLAVPEPMTLAMLGTGLLGLGMLRRRRSA